MDATRLDELIEEALAEEPAIEPGARFHAGVMREVRRATRPPLPFPRARVVAGLALAAAAAGLALLAPDGPPATLPSLADLAPLTVLVIALPHLLLAWRRAR
jgi:hypothetical protein